MAQPTPVRAFERRKPARKPFPEHLPRERVVVAAPATCACCGSSRIVKMGEDITETLKVIPVSGRWSRQCARSSPAGIARRSEDQPATGAVPRHSAGLGRFQPDRDGGLREVRQHQPLNRLGERFAREGVELSLSTLADLVGHATVALEPLHALIAQHVRAADRLHGDDTTVPLLARGGALTARSGPMSG